MVGLREDKEINMLFVVGNIYGNQEALTDILTQINNFPLASNDKIIFLGNYVDFGPNSKEVIDSLRKLKEKTDNIVMLRGNRDYLMSRSNPGYFKQKGSQATLDSYRQPCHHSFAMMQHNKFAVDKFIKDRRFLASLPCYYESDKYFIVNSGVDPNKSLEDQTKGAVMFIQEGFHSSSRVYSKTIVHGNRPIKKVGIKKNRINIDTGSARVPDGVLSCAVLNDTKGDLMEVLVSTKGRLKDESDTD